MGNPNILNRQYPAPPPPAVPLERGPAIDYAAMVGCKIIWNVYQLRDINGQKLKRPDVIRSCRRGFLEVTTTAGQDRGQARVYDHANTSILNLYGVRLSKARDGGFLLHGYILITDARGDREVPQAWWCVIDLPASDWANVTNS